MLYNSLLSRYYYDYFITISWTWTSTILNNFDNRLTNEQEKRKEQANHHLAQVQQNKSEFENKQTTVTVINCVQNSHRPILIFFPPPTSSSVYFISNRTLFRSRKLQHHTHMLEIFLKLNHKNHRTIRILKLNENKRENWGGKRERL